MFADNNLVFTGGSILGAAQAVTSSQVLSTGILDMATGLIINSSTVTTYAAASSVSGVNASGIVTVFAESFGDGSNPLDLWAVIGQTFLGGTSLQIQLLGAADASSGTYPAAISGLTWSVLDAGPVVPTANLTYSATNPALIPEVSKISPTSKSLATGK
jgi:hypothetical protein